MKNIMIHIILVVVCIASMVPGVVLNAEYWPDQEWRISTPEEQGIDSAMIADMLAHIAQQQIDIHSFLLVRNGYLVTEVYADPYSPEIVHPLYSGTKSILSTLIGIAHDEGYLTGVDQKALEFFDKELTEELKPEKHDITIEHLLTMTSGLQAKPSFPLFRAEDPIKFVLDLPMIHQPGETFEYNSAALQLLTAILRQTTGEEVLAYANANLFAPLGISDVTWQTDSKGLHMGATGLSLTPRDMAKVGYLYTQNGMWNGEQILSKEWIEQAMQKQQDTTGKMNAAENDGYGYLWWMNGFEGYSAHGYGGQYIFVLPESDMVAVFTSGLGNPDFPMPHELAKTYLLPSIKSSDPIAPNPQAVQTLKAAIDQLESPTQDPVAPLPEIAKQISGKTFKIKEDGSGGYMFATVSLTFNGDSEYTSEMDWPAAGIHVMQGGLDNVFRMDVGIALKGHWQDDRTFVEHYKPMDNQIGTSIQKYTFDGKTLMIDVESSMGSYSFQAIAELVE